MAEPIATPGDILAFWREAGPERWFTASPEFDAACEAYRSAALAARRGALNAWQSSPDGALALVLLLDQFSKPASRNASSLGVGR